MIWFVSLPRALGDEVAYLRGILRFQIKWEVRESSDSLKTQEITEETRIVMRQQRALRGRNDAFSLAVHKAIEQLSPKLRQVAEPYFLDGYDRNEIRDTLTLTGITAATIRKRFERAYKSIQEMLFDMAVDRALTAQEI